jgi:hypothetical protein
VFCMFAWYSAGIVSSLQLYEMVRWHLTCTSVSSPLAVAAGCVIPAVFTGVGVSFFTKTCVPVPPLRACYVQLCQLGCLE